MRLSIIIPNYNGGKTIKKTLQSIYSEKIKDFEVIVIDDASTDASVKTIEQFPVILIKLKKNKGAAFARNTGIKKSKSDFLIFIDSDAWFSKGSLETLVKNFNNREIVFPKLIYDDKQELYPVLDIEKTYPHISGCFGIKKKSLDKLDEYFDETYETYLEDSDFFMRCNLAGLKAKYVSKSIVVHSNKENLMDYSIRYYLEIKNTLYGILKLGKLAKKTKMYNPFTVFSLLKNIFYGFMNYAWFNWYKNSRISFKNKLICIILRKNKISSKPFFIRYTYKAITQNFQNLEKTIKKQREVRKFYKKSNYL